MYRSDVFPTAPMSFPPPQGAAGMAMESVRYVRLLRKPKARARTSNRVCMTVAYATAETGAFDGDQNAKCSTVSPPSQATSQRQVNWDARRASCGGRELVMIYVTWPGIRPGTGGDWRYRSTLVGFAKWVGRREGLQQNNRSRGRPARPVRSVGSQLYERMPSA